MLREAADHDERRGEPSAMQWWRFYASSEYSMVKTGGWRAESSASWVRNGDGRDLICHVAAERASWWLARIDRLERLAAGRGGIYFSVETEVQP